MTSIGEAQPLFLLSMPRSGSTLLGLILGNHDAICCPPEPWIALAVAEYLKVGNVSETPYGREWAEIAAVEFLLALERKQRGILSKNLCTLGEITATDATVVARNFLRTAYQLYLNTSGKTHFVDKTPRYYAILELLNQLFPKAKKIVLLRNPLDIFASYKSTWGVQREIFDAQSVQVSTRDFCEGLFTLADYAFRPNSDVLVLRYEDLTSAPDEALHLVCEFIGVPFSPRMLRYFENTALVEEYMRSPVGDPIAVNQPMPPNGRTVNSWEHRLDTADVQSIVNVLGAHIFARLGYESVLTRLQEVPVSIPTERQALDRRQLLMRSLIGQADERPFSTWNNFVLPLRENQARLAAERVQSHHLHEWAERAEMLLLEQREESERLRRWAEQSDATLTSEKEASGQLLEWAERTEALLQTQREEAESLRKEAAKTAMLLQSQREEIERLRRLAEQSNTALSSEKEVSRQLRTILNSRKKLLARLLSLRLKHD